MLMFFGHILTSLPTWPSRLISENIQFVWYKSSIGVTYVPLTTLNYSASITPSPSPWSSWLWTTSTSTAFSPGGAPTRPAATGEVFGNWSKHGGPANHGQGGIEGALVRNSAGCWRGGANLARRGLGAMEERGGGARLQLSWYSSLEGEALKTNHFHFWSFLCLWSWEHCQCLKRGLMTRKYSPCWIKIKFR